MRGIRPLHRVLLAAVLLVGTAINVRFALRTGDALSCYNLGVDTDKYDAAARRIVATGRLDVPPLQPPGYILYLALVYKLSGLNVVVPKLLACAMLLLTAYGGWRLGASTAGPGAGFVTAALLICSPVLRAYAATIQYEVPAALLFLASVSAVRAASSRGLTGIRRLAGLSGAALLCALTTLTRETFLFVFPVLLVYVVVSTKAPLRERAAVAAVMAAVFASVLGAWSVIQHGRTGQWILVSQKGPLVLLYGHNPNANGTYNATLKPVVEPAGWNFIRRHPGAEARLALRKVGYFFGFLKDGWNVPRRSALLVARLTFGRLSLVVCEAIARSAVSVLALVGFVLVLGSRRLRRELWLVPAVVGAVVCLHVATLSTHRFAVPVLPLLFLSAAIAIVAIVKQLSVRVPRRLLVAGIAGSAVWAAVAHAVPAPVSARVEGEELDGLLAEDVVDPQAGNGWARHADAARGRREMATWTDEFLPRGRFSLDFDLRSDRPGELVEVLVPLEGGGMAAKQLLRLRGTGGYERLRVTGNLDRDTSVKVVVTTVGKARIWLDGFDLDAGLPTGMEGALFGEPGVREAEIDFGGEGPWANWQKEGWSGREKTGEGLTFQWTTGTKSVLLVPITKPYDLVVDLRALPFDPPGAGPQRLDLLVNGLEAGSMTLRPGWQWYRLSVPRSSLRSGPNRFELLHARAIRPMYVPGAGSDARELAVAYDVLRLTRR